MCVEDDKEKRMAAHVLGLISDAGVRYDSVATPLVNLIRHIVKDVVNKETLTTSNQEGHTRPAHGRYIVTDDTIINLDRVALAEIQGHRMITFHDKLHSDSCVKVVFTSTEQMEKVWAKMLCYFRAL